MFLASWFFICLYWQDLLYFSLSNWNAVVVDHFSLTLLFVTGNPSSLYNYFKTVYSYTNYIYHRLSCISIHHMHPLSK